MRLRVCALILLVLTGCARNPAPIESIWQPDFRGDSHLFTTQWFELLDNKLPYDTKWSGGGSLQVLATDENRPCQDTTIFGKSTLPIDVITWCASQKTMVVSNAAMAAGAQQDIDGVIATLIIQYIRFIQGTMDADCLRGAAVNKLGPENLSLPQEQRLKDRYLTTDATHSRAEWERGFNDPTLCLKA